MKKNALLLAMLALPMFTLSACNKMSYGYHSDSLPTIDRNGDLLLYRNSASLRYQSATIEGNIDIYKKNIAEDQDFFLLFTRDTCSHCRDLEPAFVDFAYRSGLRIYRDAISDENGFKAWLDSYSNGGLSKIKDRLATPVIHLIKANKGEPEAFYKDFLPSSDSGSSLSTYFSKQLNRTNIYYFSTLGGIQAFRDEHKESLYYFPSDVDNSFYREKIYGFAKKSDKPLCYIELANFSDADKERLASMFPTSYSDSYLYLDGGNATAASFRSETLEAEKIIKNYYNA